MNVRPPPRLRPVVVTVLARARAGLREVARSSVQAGRELGDRTRLRPRLLDDAETVASVLLAIAFAHLLDVRNVGWAAFSGYMVMRTRLSISLSRGGRRVLGTFAGAALGWAALLMLGHAHLVMSAALLLGGTLTLYGALTRRHSYAWLFTGLTFAMVVLDTLAAPQIEVARFAGTRMVEVLAGTVACLIVGVISTLTIRPRLLGAAAPLSPVETANGWHRPAAAHAAQGGLALALLPLLAPWLSGETLSQAAITIIAVMTVPLSSLSGGDGLVSRRIVHRFAGCLAGALAAGLALLLCPQHPLAVTLLLILGVAAGRHLENHAGRYAYVGTQFSLVYLVVFVPDSYSQPHLAPGMERLFGIALGMLILQLIRLTLRRWPHRPV